MKKMLFLFLAISLIALLAEFAGVSNKKVWSQAGQSNRGSITGKVYAREQDKDTTSLFFEIQGLKGRYSDYDAGEKSPSTVAYSIGAELATISDIRFRGAYNKVARAPNLSELFGSPDKTSDQKLANEWQASPGNQLALAPTATGVMKIDTSTFATSWDGKWDVGIEETKDRISVNFKDKDPSTPEDNFYGRIDVKAGIDYVLKEKIKLEVKYEEKTVYKSESKPIPLNKSGFNNAAANSIFSMPYTLRPERGEEAYGSIDTTFLERPVKELSFYPPLLFGFALEDKSGDGSSASRFIPANNFQVLPDGNFIKIILPEDAKPTDSIRVFGVDVFGSLFLNAPLTETQILAQNQTDSCKAGMSGTNKYVFAGRRLCVCGCFGSESFPLFNTVLSAFTLDGKQVNPIAFSSTTATFLIPPNATPGLHRLGYADAAGITKNLDFRVLQLQGQINQKDILRGASTQMILRILGTEEGLPLRYENTTTDIIRISEGDKKTVMTSGGTNNEVRGTVTGIKVGNFNIEYALDEAPCPCLETRQALRKTKQPTSSGSIRGLE